MQFGESSWMNDLMSVVESHVDAMERKDLIRAAEETFAGGIPIESSAVAPGVAHPEQNPAAESIAATSLSAYTDHDPAESAITVTSTAPTPSTSRATHVTTAPSGPSMLTRERLQQEYGDEHYSRRRSRSLTSQERKEEMKRTTAIVGQYYEDMNNAKNAKIEHLSRKLKAVSLA